MKVYVFYKESMFDGGSEILGCYGDPDRMADAFVKEVSKYEGGVEDGG